MKRYNLSILSIILVTLMGISNTKKLRSRNVPILESIFSTNREIFKGSTNPLAFINGNSFPDNKNLFNLQNRSIVESLKGINSIFPTTNQLRQAPPLETITSQNNPIRVSETEKHQNSAQQSIVGVDKLPITQTTISRGIGDQQIPITTSIAVQSNPEVGKTINPIIVETGIGKASAPVEASIPVIVGGDIGKESSPIKATKPIIFEEGIGKASAPVEATIPVIVGGGIAKPSDPIQATIPLIVETGIEDKASAPVEAINPLIVGGGIGKVTSTVDAITPIIVQTGNKKQSDPVENSRNLIIEPQTDEIGVNTDLPYVPNFNNKKVSQTGVLPKLISQPIQISEQSNSSTYFDEEPATTLSTIPNEINLNSGDQNFLTENFGENETGVEAEELPYYLMNE